MDFFWFVLFLGHSRKRNLGVRPPDFIAINKSMEQNKKPPGQHYAKKAPSRGGARQGAGRPKGSTNKITMEELLASLDKSLGRPYHEQLADNYVNSINRSDWSGVRDYDRVFLGKVVADKLEIETTESDDAVQAKAQAFAEALTALTQVNKK